MWEQPAILKYDEDEADGCGFYENQNKAEHGFLPGRRDGAGVTDAWTFTRTTEWTGNATLRLATGRGRADATSRGSVGP